MELETYKMIYEIDEKEEKNEKFRILGDEFVNNNKNRAKLIINNKKCDLESKRPIEKRTYAYRIRYVHRHGIRRMETITTMISETHRLMIVPFIDSAFIRSYIPSINPMLPDIPQPHPLQ